jgi:hypothetical protein
MSDKLLIETCVRLMLCFVVMLVLASVFVWAFVAFVYVVGMCDIGYLWITEWNPHIRLLAASCTAILAATVTIVLGGE